MAKATIEYDDEFNFLFAFVPWDESNIGEDDLDSHVVSNVYDVDDYIKLMGDLTDAGLKQFGENA